MRMKKNNLVSIVFLLFTLMTLTLFSCDIFSQPKENGNTIKITITTTGLSAYREYWIGVIVKNPYASVSTSATRRDSNGTLTLTISDHDITSEAERRLWEGEDFYFLILDRTVNLRRFSVATYNIDDARTFTLDLETHFRNTWQSEIFP